MSASDVIEPFAVPDVFVSGSARVEWLGSNLRLTLYVQQTGYDGRPERAVVSRLVGSWDDMKNIAGAIVAAGMIAGTDQTMAGRGDSSLQ